MKKLLLPLILLLTSLSAAAQIADTSWCNNIKPMLGNPAQSINFWTNNAFFHGNIIADSIFGKIDLDTSLFFQRSDTSSILLTQSKASNLYQLKNSASTSVDTSYNAILAIRPNKSDTIFKIIDSIKNTSLFPKGTFFHIYKGNHTASVNLARDSCFFYFDAGSYITKASSGSIFDYTGITNPIKILGYGSFYKTATSGKVFYSNQDTYVNFEFSIASATNDNTIEIISSSNANIKGDYLISSGGKCIYSTGTFLTSNINKIYSTGGIAVDTYYNNNFINSNLVQSTNGYGVLDVVDVVNYHSTYNISYVTGSTYGYGINSSEITINGNTSSIYCTTWASFAKVNYNGLCHWLYFYSNYGGNFIGGLINNLSLGSGYVKSTILPLRSDGVYGSITINDGGIADLTFSNNRSHNTNSYIPKIDISNGTLTLNGFLTCDRNYDNEYWLVSGGTLFLNVDFSFLNPTLLSGGDARIITQTGGTIIFNGKIKSTSTLPYSPLIVKTGGNLILNNAILIKNLSTQQFINCPSSAQDISVYSGGVSTNGSTGDLLSAKARKDSLVVNIVDGTKIILDDGSGSETFQESDLATYNTTELLAQRLASLINASSSLDITATYVSGSTLNIEADSAGTDYTQSELNNLTNHKLRLNSFPITNNVGGSIIENSNVIF